MSSFSAHTTHHALTVTMFGSSKTVIWHTNITYHDTYDRRKHITHSHALGFFPSVHVCSVLSMSTSRHVTNGTTSESVRTIREEFQRQKQERYVERARLLELPWPRPRASKRARLGPRSSVELHTEALNKPVQSHCDLSRVSAVVGAQHGGGGCEVKGGTVKEAGEDEETEDDDGLGRLLLDHLGVPTLGVAWPLFFSQQNRGADPRRN